MLLNLIYLRVKGGTERPTVAINTMNVLLLAVYHSFNYQDLSAEFSCIANSPGLNRLFSENGFVGMFERKHFKILEKIMSFLEVVPDQYLNECHVLVTKVLKLYVKLLKRLDGIHIFMVITDAEITETSILIKVFKSAAINVFSEFNNSSMGTEKFHHSDHILSDMKEMGSLKYLSAGPFEHSHFFFKRL